MPNDSFLYDEKLYARQLESRDLLLLKRSKELPLKVELWGFWESIATPVGIVKPYRALINIGKVSGGSKCVASRQQF